MPTVLWVLERQYQGKAETGSALTSSVLWPIGDVCEQPEHQMKSEVRSPEAQELGVSHGPGFPTALQRVLVHRINRSH